ncbi:MAG TPA: glycosyl transferase [Gammaproteobacteria bacterium]|jgi:glycosyltransferase involved in cell wall biosynthesis|nr:glycosyl transferase [Gammaproteobacteria bacterium]
MSERPALSVVMPVKNGGQWLHTAVDSVLQQSFTDFELLVIDDHSFDGSVEQLPQDPRLKVLRHPGSGIVESLNHGLVKAKGEFIARMDGADICHPERFQRQMDFAHQHPQVGIVGGLVEIFSDGSTVSDDNISYQEWLNRLQSHAEIARELFVHAPFLHSSVLMRKPIFQKVGLYRDLSWPEDYDLWLRAWLRGIEFAKVPELVLMWREHPERITHTDRRYATKEFIKAKAWALSESLLKDRSAIICGTSKAALKLCDVLRALGVRVAGFADVTPDSADTQHHDLPTLSYEAMLAQRGDALLIGALGRRGASEQLRQIFAASRLVEGHDFILAG